MLELRPLTDHIGVEVLNVDATRPLDNDAYLALRAALNTHSVLLLRGQAVSEARHVEFARQFGELQVHVLSQYLTTPYPELYVLSNVKQDGKPIGNHKEGWNWHSDWSYLEVPCFGSVLHAVEVPPVGADTLFSSMYAAYDALDEDLRRQIQSLSAIHSYSTYYAKAFADREPLTDAQKKPPRMSSILWSGGTRKPADHHCLSGRILLKKLLGYLKKKEMRYLRS